MSDYIKLADNFTINIEDGASLDHIVHIASNDANAVAVCKKITAANLKTVKFYDTINDAPYGEYEDLISNYTPTRATNEDGTVTVIISLREPNELEKRVMELENSQELQNEVLDSLLMI